MELWDGTVVPSGLNASSESILNYEKNVSDYCLRVGRVIAAYEPSDSLNRNKKYVEYDVEVNYANKNEPYTKIIYPRAVVASLFGGVADYIRWTPRADNFNNQNQIGYGSRVLLLCINGNSRFSYIISGLPNPNSILPNEKFKDNHHFQFEFNGIRGLVDNNGDFSLMRRGPTKVDGSLAQNNFDKSFISMTQGAVELIYESSDGNNSYVSLIDSSKVALKSQSEIDLDTSTVNINAPQGIKVNAANEAWINGTTYRFAQFNLDSLLAQLATTAGSELAAAAAQLPIPVVGSILAAPHIAAAGAALTAMGDAYNAFELGAPTYVSNIHGHSDFPTTVQLQPEPEEDQNNASNDPKPQTPQPS